MNIVIDLIAIAILIFFVFFGYKRGLVGVVFNLLSFLIAAVIAFLLCKPVTNFIVQHTTWDEAIQAQISATMSSDNEASGQEATANSTPEMWIASFNQNIKQSTQQAKEAIVENSASSIAYGVINLGVLLSLFIGTKLLLWIIQLFTKFLTDLPILKQFNALGGIFFGIIEGFFWLYLLLAICSILPIPNLQTWLSTSYFTSMLYHHNLILMVLF